MTKTQKALRGIGGCLLSEVKPKVGRRLDRDRHYRDRFWNTQTLNMQRAARRVLARANLARAYLATTTPTPGAMREAQQTAALNSAQGPQP